MGSFTLGMLVGGTIATLLTLAVADPQKDARGLQKRMPKKPARTSHLAQRGKAHASKPANASSGTLHGIGVFA